MKLADDHKLSYQEWSIYKLLTCHFLGSLSKDAVGNETTIKIDIEKETFTASGLIIEEKNFLEIYTFDKWNATTLPTDFYEGQKIKPKITCVRSGTKAPNLLTEADLITQMDNNGIGTDATIHEHIKTVQERGYATKKGEYI